MKTIPALFNRERNLDPLAVKLLMLTLLAMLVLSSGAVHAQSTGNVMNFPIIDEFLCGFISYSKNRLAPMIAIIVVIFSIVGHWLGSGKMWNVLLYVGLGIGVILGIGSVIARYSSLAQSCI